MTVVGQDHLQVEGKRGWGLFGDQGLPSNSLSHLTMVGQTHPWGSPAAGHWGCAPQPWEQCTALRFTPGCCSGCVPVCTWSHLPPSEMQQSCQLRAGQSRVSGTDVSLGLSLTVTHLFSSEGRAQGNSPQPKYRAGFPGTSDTPRCRKATRVAGNLPGERPRNCRVVREQLPQRVLLRLVHRAGLGSCRPASTCCLQRVAVVLNTP